MRICIFAILKDVLFLQHLRHMLLFVYVVSKMTIPRSRVQGFPSKQFIKKFNPWRSTHRHSKPGPMPSWPYNLKPVTTLLSINQIYLFDWYKQKKKKISRLLILFRLWSFPTQQIYKNSHSLLGMGFDLRNSIENL